MDWELPASPLAVLHLTLNLGIKMSEVKGVEELTPKIPSGEKIQLMSFLFSPELSFLFRFF